MRPTYLLFALALLMALPAAPAGAQFDAGCPAANVNFSPVTATHTTPPYPALSQRMGEQGTTSLRVSIDPHTGTVSDVAVERSSGSLRLDDAAAIFVKQNWKWTVSRFDCASGAIVTLVSIKWDLREPVTSNWATVLTMEDKDFPAGARDKKEHGDSLVALFLTESGAVAGARAATTSGYADLDAKAVEIVKSRSWKTAQMNGNPVKTTVLIVVQWPAAK